MNYIGGEFRESKAKDWLPVLDPVSHPREVRADS